MKKRKLYAWIEEEFLRQAETHKRLKDAFDKKKNPSKAEWEKTNVQSHKVTALGILDKLCEELSKGTKFNVALEKVANDILKWRR